MHSVLVTGANGFTGSALANELARRGACVNAFVRQGAELSLLDRGFIADGRIRLCYGDVRDPLAVEKATKGVERVYHIAALYRSAKPINVNANANANARKQVCNRERKRKREKK